MEFEIKISADEELIKKEKENNLALQQKKESEAIAKQHKKDVAVITQIGLMSARNLVTSKVGEVFRDTLLQRKIDLGFGVASTIGAFIVHPALGAINMATSLASQSIDYEINSRREQSRLEIIGGRAGYVNRSR